MTLTYTIGTLVLVEGIVFWIAALLHMGVTFAGLREPRIMPSAAIESLIGLFFFVSAYAIFTQNPLAWLVTVGAHDFAVAATLVDIFAVTDEPGVRTPANWAYQRVMLTIAITSVVVLLTPVGRIALNA